MVESTNWLNSPENIYKIGEWFNPFYNYEDLPRVGLPFSQMRYSLNQFEVDRIGKINVGILKGRGNISKSVFVLSLVGPAIVQGDQIEECERRVSAFLLEPSFFPVDGKDLFGYRLELNLSGFEEIYYNQFRLPGYDGNSSTHPLKWHQEGSMTEQFERGLLIPEREYILNKLQTRIVPNPV
jgi:hypothetical protein